MTSFLWIAFAFIVILAMPFYLAHLYWWFWFWIALAVVLGIFELAALAVKKKTLSQMFWQWAKENPVKKYFILAAMLIFWTILLAHLFIK